MKFIIVNITYKGILKLILLFQTLQLIAQGLSHQLKSKGLWNFIIFPKTALPAERELKPNYSNSNKLMLKMLKPFKM